MEFEFGSFFNAFIGCIAGLAGGAVIVAGSVFKDVGVDLGKYDHKGWARKILFLVMACVMGGGYGFFAGIESKLDIFTALVLGGGWLHAPAIVLKTSEMWFQAKAKQMQSPPIE